jgi:hypothetical protein
MNSAHGAEPHTLQPYCQSCHEPTASNGGQNCNWYRWQSPRGLHYYVCHDCLYQKDSIWPNVFALLKKANYGSGPAFPSPTTKTLSSNDLYVTQDFEAPQLLDSAGELSLLDPFEHSGLGAGGQRIRILRLLPDSRRDNVIKCELETVLFTPSYSSYTALSYVWGASSQQSVLMLLNGKVFRIYQSLHLAFLQLRHPEKVIRLWIDAICINQDPKNPEKAVQVGLMSRIYRQASNVLIWLGPSTDSTNHAMDCINRADAKEICSGNFNINVMELLSRPWFQRTWTIQEMMLNSKSPIMLCGSRFISWRSLSIAQLCSMLTSMALDSKPDDGAIQILTLGSRSSQFLESPIGLLRGGREIMQLQGGYLSVNPLYSALELSKRSQASDPRDRIYGVRGLIREDIAQHLPPVNYDQDISRVYQDAAAFILRREVSALLFLRFALPLWTRRPLETWPSWVPDFDANDGDFQGPSVDDAWYRRRFRPLNMTSKAADTVDFIRDHSHLASADIGGKVLLSNGVGCDEILHCSESSIAKLTLFMKDRAALENHGSLAQEWEETREKVALWVEIEEAMPPADRLTQMGEGSEPSWMNSGEDGDPLSLPQARAFLVEVQQTAAASPRLTSSQELAQSRRLCQLRQFQVSTASKGWILLKKQQEMMSRVENLPVLEYWSIVETLTKIDRLCKANSNRLKLGQHHPDLWLTSIWESLFAGFPDVVDIFKDRSRCQRAFASLLGADIHSQNRLSRRERPAEFFAHDAVLLKLTFQKLFFQERSFFITDRGSYGLAPSQMRKGDTLAFLFPPWYLPMILRPVKTTVGMRYIMIGPALIPESAKFDALLELEMLKLLGDSGKATTFSII